MYDICTFTYLLVHKSLSDAEPLKVNSRAYKFPPKTCGFNFLGLSLFEVDGWTKVFHDSFSYQSRLTGEDAGTQGHGDTESRSAPRNAGREAPNGASVQGSEAPSKSKIWTPGIGRGFNPRPIPVSASPFSASPCLFVNKLLVRKTRQPIESKIHQSLSSFLM